MKQLNVKNYLTKEDMRYTDYVEFVELCKGDLIDMDLQFLTNRTLKIFYDISPKDIRLLQFEQIDLLINKCNAVISLPESPFKNIILMGGKEYGFFNMSEATAGELIDLDACMDAHDIVSLTSIVYRPIIGKVNSKGEYRIEPYSGYDQKFKDVSLSIVEGYLSFFLKSCEILRVDTHIYSV